MTSRNLPAGMTTAQQGAHVTGFLFVELQLDGGTEYLTSCPHDVDWNGHTWTSAWGVSDVSPLVESGNAIEGLKMMLSHVDPANIAAALSLDVQGRRCILRYAVVDAGTLYVDPATWTGKMDTLGITSDAETGTITLTAEHDLATWETPNLKRFSDADQRSIDPTDKFFEYAAALSKTSIVWPGKEFFQQ